MAAMNDMQDHPILGQVILGYSPMIDRQRQVVATRLTVFPERPDAQPDMAALLVALAEVWPDEGAGLSLTLRALDGAAPKATAPAAPLAGPPVSLNIAGEGLLQSLLAASPGPQWMIEVPAFMAADPAHAAALRALHDSGHTLLIKGRPVAELPRELLPCFSHSIIDVNEERRTSAPPPFGVRAITTVQAGVRSQVAMEAAFQRGALAALGWPLDDPVLPGKGRVTVPPDLQVIMALINGVDRELPASQLEAMLKRDATLAFRLMRYLNSPAFGLQVEINSFGHALMMLGHHRLKRWLALLLVSASKDAHMKPVMFAALRRGLLMEELVRNSGDAEMRGEMFICGVFSLLDLMLRQPFDELLKTLPVPDRVQQALGSGGGPFMPYLELVRAIENESLFDVRECADRLFMDLAEVNRALLVTLRAARQLDS